jgi:hypothetical protein
MKRHAPLADAGRLTSGDYERTAREDYTNRPRREAGKIHRDLQTVRLFEDVNGRPAFSGRRRALIVEGGEKAAEEFGVGEVFVSFDLKSRHRRILARGAWHLLRGEGGTWKLARWKGPIMARNRYE